MVVEQLQAILHVVLLLDDIDLTTEAIGKVKHSILSRLALHCDDDHDLARVSKCPWVRGESGDVPSLGRVDVAVVGEHAFVVDPVDLDLLARVVPDGQWKICVAVEGFYQALCKCLLRRLAPVDHVLVVFFFDNE